MTLARLNRRSSWLLRFVLTTENRLGPGCGYCTHLPLPADHEPGVSMQTMRGLEKRGYVEEFMHGCFRITPEGRRVLEVIQ